MVEHVSMLNKCRKCFAFTGKIIHKIFTYLSGYEAEDYNNRTLLRRLYNSGYLDDGKYQDLCEKNSNDNLDPEELPM